MKIAKFNLGKVIENVCHVSAYLAMFSFALFPISGWLLVNGFDFERHSVSAIFGRLFWLNFYLLFALALALAILSQIAGLDSWRAEKFGERYLFNNKRGYVSPINKCL